MKIIPPVVIVVAMFASTSMAQQKDVFGIMGAGNASCAKFAEGYRLDPERIEQFYFSWAQGLMSGINIARLAMKQPIRDLNAWRVADQESHIRQFCDQRPLSNYADAVNDLFRALPEVSPQSN
jgi:hypothetical protein